MKLPKFIKSLLRIEEPEREPIRIDVPADVEARAEKIRRDILEENRKEEEAAIKILSKLNNEKLIMAGIARLLVRNADGPADQTISDAILNIIEPPTTKKQCHSSTARNARRTGTRAKAKRATK